MDLASLPPTLRPFVQALGDEDEITPAFLADLAALAGDLRTLVEYLGRLVSFANRESVALLNEASLLTWWAGKHEDAKRTFQVEALWVLDDASLQVMTVDGYRVAVESSPPLLQIDPAVADPTTADSRFVQVRRVWDQAALMAAYRMGDPLPAGVSVQRVRYPKIIPLAATEFL